MLFAVLAVNNGTQPKINKKEKNKREKFICQLYFFKVVVSNICDGFGENYFIS